MQSISLHYFLALALFCVSFSSCKEEIVEPEPPGTLFTDTRDGQGYLSIVIGTQTWMAENLRYQASGSICYEGLAENCTNYGYLYSFDQARNACPTGWHLPTDDEWGILEAFLGMDASDLPLDGWRGTNQGAQLKEGGGSGFRANMAGFRINQTSAEQGNKTAFWSQTDDPSNLNFVSGRELNSSDKRVRRLGLRKTDDYSVRCLKD